MRAKQRKFRDCHSQRPLHQPCSSVSLRTIIDRSTKGLPINAKLPEHQPLPPDGDNMDDWNTGTEEIIDLVDAQQASEKVKAYYDEQEKKKQEAIDKKKEEEFNNAVEAEIARRAEQVQQS